MTFTDVIALHWLRPQWLLALLALPLLALWWRARRRRQSVWRAAVDPHLLPHLLEPGGGARAHGALWIGLATYALAVMALAGPSWQRDAQPLWQSRAPLVVALDLSGASLAGDLPPSRLLQARAKIATLLRLRAGGQTSLVAFADDAYTVAPLTDDAANVGIFLDALAPDVMPVDGSRADRAIAWSARLLQQSGFGRGDILLLTDHADAVARTAASTAAGQGYRVSVLGLGTTRGAAYRDADGRIVHAQLDARSLQALARAGGGSYAALGPGNADLAAVGVLDPRRAGAIAAHGEKALLWRDQGYWLLPPLMLLALLAFRRGGALAALLLCACLLPPPAHAASSDWWSRPDQQAHARQEQGVQAYRRGDFNAAEQAWHALPGADAAYNRGNALAEQGRYDEAIAAYDRALQLHPGMEDAIANRRAVEAAKRRQPPPSSQKQGAPQSSQAPQRGDRDPSQSSAAGQGDKPSGSSSEPASPSDSQSTSQSRSPAPQSQPQQRPRSVSTPTPQRNPQDARAQQQADAAQRRRMQQALREDRAPAEGTPAAKSPQPAETAAQREQRLADEAWLRRVPDEPGNLLRARFRLEYERRQQEGTP